MCVVNLGAVPLATVLSNTWPLALDPLGAGTAQSPAAAAPLDLGAPRCCSGLGSRWTMAAPVNPGFRRMRLCNAPHMGHLDSLKHRHLNDIVLAARGTRLSAA